jgi:hypothetical protein
MSELKHLKEELILQLEVEFVRIGFTRHGKQLTYYQDTNQFRNIIDLRFHYRSKYYDITMDASIIYKQIETTLYRVLGKKMPKDMGATIGEYIRGKDGIGWVLYGSDDFVEVFTDMISGIQSALSFFETHASLEEALSMLLKDTGNDSLTAQKALVTAFLLGNKGDFEGIIKTVNENLGWVAKNQEVRYAHRRQSYEEFMTLVNQLKKETNW